MIDHDIIVWRSMLYVPANNQRFVAKAHARGADAVILDLEDSVPARERTAARQRLQESAETVGQSGADVIVRINRPILEAIRDLEAAVSPRIRALLVTKAASPDHVRLIAEAVSALEMERGMAVGHTRLIPMIETPAALLIAVDIARADGRVAALVLGGEDFATTMGMEPASDTLMQAKLQCLTAARAAGVMPLGFIGTVADYGDRDAFRETVRRSRRFGFEGASCIHPSGVDILNEEMSPSAEDVDWAERVVDAYATAEATGSGAITIDGKMVDVPVADRARATLARHQAIINRQRAVACD